MFDIERLLVAMSVDQPQASAFSEACDLVRIARCMSRTPNSFSMLQAPSKRALHLSFVLDLLVHRRATGTDCWSGPSAVCSHFGIRQTESCSLVMSRELLPRVAVQHSSCDIKYLTCTLPMPDLLQHLEYFAVADVHRNAA